MKQTQLLGTQTLLLTEDHCDYGVEPRSGTTLELDVLIHDKHVEVVAILGREGIKLTVSILSTRLIHLVSLVGSLREFASQARVSIVQGDPMAPDVWIMVLHRQTRFERHLIANEELKQFLNFPFEDGVSDDESDSKPEDFVI